MKKDFSKVPATVTIANVSSEVVEFRYFRVNFVEKLQPADEVVLTVASSEEVAYYVALEDANLKVTVA